MTRKQENVTEKQKFNTQENIIPLSMLSSWMGQTLNASHITFYTCHIHVAMEKVGKVQIIKQN